MSSSSTPPPPPPSAGRLNACLETDHLPTFSIDEFRAMKKCVSYGRDGIVYILDLSDFSHPGPPLRLRYGTDVTREFDARRDTAHAGKDPLSIGRIVGTLRRC